MIVVAIIAVLVAIAVPLFVGSLNDAEKNVKNANERAVRGAAVEEILIHYEAKSYALEKSSTKTETGWTATADITSDGQIENLTIAKVTAKPSSGLGCDDKTATEGYKYKVTIYLAETEVK